VGVRMCVYKYIFQRTTSDECQGTSAIVARSARAGPIHSESSQISQNTETSSLLSRGVVGRRKRRKESRRRRCAISAVFLPSRVFFSSRRYRISLRNKSARAQSWNRLTFPVTGIPESYRRPDPPPPSVSRTRPRISRTGAPGRRCRASCGTSYSARTTRPRIAAT